MAGMSQKASGDYKPGRLFLIKNEFLNNQDNVPA
jgi:hypothetical protein